MYHIVLYISYCIICIKLYHLYQTVLNMKYTLEKYSGPKSRFICPNCKQKGEFSRYINNKTNSYISDEVGKCNRIDKCGYHSTPKEYFKNNNIVSVSNDTSDTNDTRDTLDTSLIQYDTIPFDLVSKTFDSNIALNTNNFVKYLLRIFNDSLTIDLINKFKIGTAKNNYTLFYQIDTEGNIRTGKKILYDSLTGKRKDSIVYIHKKIDLNYKLNQCFFGLNQLQNNYENVAIFESEKSAVLMSVYLENFICLAAGGSNMLNLEKFKILKDKKCKSVILFPDKSYYDSWKEIAIKFSKILNMDLRVSKVLEKSDITNKGDDLADYLNYDINYNWVLSSGGYPLFWDYPK